MTVPMDKLLVRLATVPGELPADAAAGLAAVAARTSPDSPLRNRLIARADVPRPVAAALAGTPVLLVHAAELITRPDTSTADAIRLLADVAGRGDGQVTRRVALTTKDAALLEHLSTSADETTLQNVATNPRTPVAVAAAAVSAALDAGQRAAPGRAAYVGWLKHSHQVPTPVIDAWAQTVETAHVFALSAAVASRPEISPGALSRLSGLLLRELDRSGPVLAEQLYDALSCAVHHRQSTSRTRGQLRDALAAGRFTYKGVLAVERLGFPKAGPTMPATRRSWRALTKDALRETSSAQAPATRQLVAELATALGDDPQAWLVLASLGAEHTGTVGDLTTTALAVTQPALRSA